jgi:CTP synthase
VTHILSSFFFEFQQVPSQNIVSVHNVSEIYKVPLVLQKQNVAEIISEKLQMYLPKGMPNIAEWENLCRRLDNVELKVDVA